MTRLFVSLYVFVALSILSLGFGLERLLFEPPITSPSQQALLKLTSSYSDDTDLLFSLLQDAGANVSTMSLSQFSSNSSLGQLLARGEVVDGIANEQWTLYIPTDNGGVAVARFPAPTNPSQPWRLYSALFFGFLGAALAIWVAPIGRDLKRLSLAANSLSDKGTLDIPNVSNRSPLKPLVQGYETLNAKIQDLLVRHKALAGAITHEFKTPLARLKFALVTAGEYDQTQIDAIHADIAELEKLVHEMLDFSRLDTQEPNLHIAHIPLHDFCQQCIDKYVPTTHKQIQLRGTKTSVLADDRLLARAVENLISNALRHAKSRVEVSISDHSGVCICVEDDGFGVNDIDKDKVFEPFYRADGHRSRSHGGTGLGLAIVKRVMQWHQGRCNVSQSNLGGAKFCLKFAPDKT